MDMNAFLPPMFGSFLGVGLGILANHFYQIYIADKNKNKYKIMIKSEIELGIKRLEDDLIKFIPLDRWNSAVNSGALKLFDVEKELGPLSVLYERIKDYNYVVTTGHFNDSHWSMVELKNDSLEDEEIPENVYDRTKQRASLLERRNTLLKELRSLNNADWLNPSNETAPEYNYAYRYEVNERQ